MIWLIGRPNIINMSTLFLVILDFRIPYFRFLLWLYFFLFPHLCPKIRRKSIISKIWCKILLFRSALYKTILIYLLLSFNLERNLLIYLLSLKCIPITKEKILIRPSLIELLNIYIVWRQIIILSDIARYFKRI